VLMHAHVDTVDFVVGDDAHHHASSFKFTHLTILGTLADPLLEVCCGHTPNSLLVRYLNSCMSVNSLSNGLQGWHIPATSLSGDRFAGWFSTLSCSRRSSTSL
jgi:hypothetical protein